jgi:malate dehydrogenase (oxaloacetate-decarboxylating)
LALDYTYRVHLPHRIGQLARVAGAIAEGNGLIGDVEYHQRRTRFSVREITLEVDDQPGPSASPTF